MKDTHYASENPDQHTLHLISSLAQELGTMKDTGSVIRFCMTEFIPQLKIPDFVIYKYIPSGKMLKKCASLQKIYFGSNEPYRDIVLKPGSGIVGQCALKRQSMLIDDTENYEEYVVDEEKRFSELSCPVLYKNQLIGVLDSEHPDKSFYNTKHRLVFEMLSALIAPHLKELPFQDSPNPNLQRFLDLLDYDQIYTDKELDLEKVADQLQITPGYFSTILHEHSRESFRQIINRYRTTHLLRLMAGAGKKTPLLSLAFESGFNSKATFNRAFKKQMGISPRQYLRSFRNHSDQSHS